MTLGSKCSTCINFDSPPKKMGGIWEPLFYRMKWTRNKDSFQKFWVLMINMASHPSANPSHRSTWRPSILLGAWVLRRGRTNSSRKAIPGKKLSPRYRSGFRDTGYWDAPGDRITGWNWFHLWNWGIHWVTLQGINISHLGKRKIIFKSDFWWDMLVPWRVIPTIIS